VYMCCKRWCCLWLIMSDRFSLIQNFSRLIGWTSLQIIIVQNNRTTFYIARNTEGDGSKEMLCDKYPLSSNNGIGSSSKEVLTTLT